MKSRNSRFPPETEKVGHFECNKQFESIVLLKNSLWLAFLTRFIDSSKQTFSNFHHRYLTFVKVALLTIGAIKVSSNKTNDFGGRNSANIKQQLFNIQERKHFISSVRNKKNLENRMRWGDVARTRIKHLLTDILRRFCFMLASLLFQQRSVSQSIHDAIKVFLISFIAHDKISGKVCGTVG